MCRTLNKINEGLLSAPSPSRTFCFYVWFGSAACCGHVVRPQDDATPSATTQPPSRTSRPSGATKIFLQSASACSAAAVNEKHISMMHATPENNIKQALPPLPRMAGQPINWPTTSSGQDLQ